MRFSLLVAPIALVLLVLSGLGMAAQDEFRSEMVQETFEKYRATLGGIEKKISDAREEWKEGMGDAQEKAMQDSNGVEVNAIQSDMDSVKGGWPSFDSGEHEVLVEGWTSASAFARAAKKSYESAVRRAGGLSKKARGALEKGLTNDLKKTLKGGSEEDLMEANRILAWLEGPVALEPVALEVAPPKGWEIISSESEAKERKLGSPYHDLDARSKPRVEIHTVLSFQSESEICWTRIDDETGEEVLYRIPDETRELSMAPTERFVFRDCGDETFIAVIVVGSEDAELVFSDSPDGGVKVAFGSMELKQRLPTVSRPWPLSEPAVKAVQEEMVAACEEMTASRASLKKEVLIERLDEVFKEVMQSGDESESNRITEFVEELKENEELALDDLGQLGITSADALAHIETYSREMAEHSSLPSEVRDDLVTKLERARSDVMKEGEASVLPMANRIQEAIRELRESESLCALVENMARGISLEIREKYEARGRALKGKRAEPIHDALDWLAAHQDPAGRWDCDGFIKHDKETADGSTGIGEGYHDVGVTGLALLAFLDCGTDLDSAHGQALIKGAQWLITQQDYATGLIGEKRSYGYMYGHAAATVALCRFYGLTGDLVFKRAGQKAINFISKARNPYGAWRYTSPPNSEQDTSVTGWMIFAMKAAEDAGLKIDPASYEGAMVWLNEATETATGRVGYKDEGSASSRYVALNDHFPTDRTECMTAVGLSCRFLLGQDPKETPIMVKHADLLLKSLPEWDPDGLSNDMYYWYYGSYSMFQMGGRHWESWNKAMKKAVLDSQRKDGSSKGSWDPIGPWGSVGGRVYATAMMASALAKIPGGRR